MGSLKIDYVERFLVGSQYKNIGINEDNTTRVDVDNIIPTSKQKIVVASAGNFVEILEKSNSSKKRTLEHESDIVGVFFIGNKKLITVTTNGEVTEYTFSDNISEVPQKTNSRRVTAFPVVAAFVQKTKELVFEEEKSDVKLWLVVKRSEAKKQKLYDVCYVCGDSSLEKIVEIPSNIPKEQIVIDDNIIAYCQETEVNVILLNSSRKVEKTTKYVQKSSNHKENESTYRFVKIAANGNHLAVSMANGMIYQWSNLKTAGVSDTFHTSHWHKVAPSLAVTQFGNLLSAGAECALLKTTKGQKQPTLLTRLIAPIVGLELSPDASTVVLLMEDNSLHTVLLATMAIKVSYSTIEYCDRSLNTVFASDPALKANVVMSCKPGSVQWINPLSENSVKTVSVTLENAVDGDMSLVGIKPAYRDVFNISFGLTHVASIEKYINFESDNHVRFWKRKLEDRRQISLVSTVAVNRDVVFISSCVGESVNYGKNVVTASTSGVISVWEFTENGIDVKEDLSRQRNWQEASIDAISSIQTNGRFASAHGKHVVLWNIPNMKIVDVLSCEDEVMKLEFSGRCLIIATKKGVVCWDTLCLIVSWRIQQKVGIHVSSAGCFAFDDCQVMHFEPETGRVLDSVKLSSPINDLIVLKLKNGLFVYLAKTDKGTLCYRPENATSSNYNQKNASSSTPFHELAKLKVDSSTNDQKFVKQPRPNAAKLFSGPVHSLPPISFIAPLFIEKSLLPPLVKREIY